MQTAMPCVGLVVLAGCLTLVIAPDNLPTVERTLPAAVAAALPTVILDPGHGGKDEGAQANGLVEKELTLDLAFRVENLLLTYGFPTVLTRRDNRYVALEERATMANRITHALFISLHFDKASNAPASGVATFYAQKKVSDNPWSWAGFFNESANENADDGEELAGAIQTALVTRTEATNRGINPQNFYVVRHVRAPAVLVEGGFLSNAFDARLLSTPNIVTGSPLRSSKA